MTLDRLQATTYCYCTHCGARLAPSAAICPKCGHGSSAGQLACDETSSKSFVIAVSLCGIFGILGIHHFYIGNIAHGLLDLGLFIAAMAFFAVAEASGSPGLAAIGAIIFVADVIHSIAVFYRLIVGKQKDGHGLPIQYPVSA